MFDFAWSEIALIAVVALVVIGPKDLPIAVRAVTSTLKKMRNIAREFQSQINEVVHDADLGDLRDLQSLNVRSHLTKILDHDGSLKRAMTPPEQIQQYSSRYSENSCRHFPDHPDQPIPISVKPYSNGMMSSEITVNSEKAIDRCDDFNGADGSHISDEEVQAAPQELPPGVVRRILEECDRLNPPAFLPPVRVLHGKKAVAPDLFVSVSSSTIV